MAGPAAPLIADGEHDDQREDEGLLTDRYAEVHVATRPPNRFVWLLTLSAGISGLLFGYDTGVISATLVSIGTSLSNRALTALDKSVITSSTALAALLVSPFASVLADRWGRRRVILLADALFALGAAVQAISGSVAGLVVGRAVVGAAIGAASFVVPLYVAEVAPPEHRGRLVTVNVLFITLGQVVAYVVGWAFAEHGDPATGWRWMVGLGALPAIVQCVLVMGMPDTPRWLVQAGRLPEAQDVVKRVYGISGEPLRATMQEITSQIREEGETGHPRRQSGRGARLSWLEPWKELFATKRNRRAVTIACLLQGLQQLCGFNSLMYFSATIFTMLGFTSPTLTSLTVASTNFVFTVIALHVIDRMGRRRILLLSIPFMVLGLLLAAYGFYQTTLPPSSPHLNTASPRAPTPTSSRGDAVVILFAIMLYVAAYALGLGNVPWMQSELFSLPVRAAGSGLATATNWGANFVVGLTFLPLMEALSPSLTFLLYAAVCAAGLVAVFKTYPETSGLSLEEAAKLLEEDGWGVR